MYQDEKGGSDTLRQRKGQMKQDKKGMEVFKK